MKKNSILMFTFLIMTISVTSAFAQASSKKQMPASSGSQQKTAEALIDDTKVVIKVVAVKDNVASTNESNKPNEDNKLVSIQIMIDNTKGEDEWKAKPDVFKLKDEEGNIYEINMWNSSNVTEPTLKSGVVDSGDFVKGWITFQVGSSVNIKSLKLRYEDSSFTSKSTVKSGWIALSAVVK